VIVGQFAVLQDAVDDGEAGLRSITHGHRDRAVEPDDGRCIDA